MSRRHVEIVREMYARSIVEMESRRIADALWTRSASFERVASVKGRQARTQVLWLTPLSTR
jgi:hypothetical protein